MFRLVLGAVAALAVAAPAFAAPAPDPAAFRARVDGFIAGEMKAENVPGVAVAVIHKGQVVMAKGYGLANIEHNVPVTPDTIFQSGSIGKMFTAAVVMRQVEQGKMALEDPVTKYLPDAPAAWRTMTIRHMLTHTSGIANGNVDQDLTREYSDEQMVKDAFAAPLDFAPGARWNYSNTAYVLLGIIVKKATGRSYLDILDTDVFKPLGMTTARGISDADIVMNRASGYEPHDGVLKNQAYVSPTLNATADGSLYFSLNDMIAWNRGVEQGKVLTPASWKQVWTPVKLNSGKPYPYGFGWRVETAGGAPRYQHGGAWQGFRTFYSRYLGDEMSVIVLTNSGGANPEKFADGVATLWDPALTDKGPKPKPEPAVDRRVAALLESGRAGTLTAQDLPQLSPAFLQMLNPYLQKFLTEAGPVKSLDLVQRKEEGDDIVYVYTATFAAKTGTLTYSVGPEGKASMFLIR
jgi:CubicO group peptidase (beta-lactamase class C family)